jgi:hypothetical protein
MFLPISLHRNKLLVAFHAMLYPPDDSHFKSHQHGVVVNIATSEVELINNFHMLYFILCLLSYMNIKKNHHQILFIYVIFLRRILCMYC